MEKLGRSANLLEVSVNKYDDLIVLNCDDISIFSKFANIYERFFEIAKDAEKKVEKLKKEYAGNSEDDIDLDEIRSYLDVHIETSKSVMAELDSLFGSDFTKKVFRENYELDPDFVPSEEALEELIEALSPIIEKAYGKRVKRNNEKYSAAKRGKHTKTKEELIEEYREKSGSSE